MANITDIKSILYTEKSLNLQEYGVVVVKTSQRVTKNTLREIFREFFDIQPLKINVAKIPSKTKRFRNRLGKTTEYKKFFVTLPEGKEIESLKV